MYNKLYIYLHSKVLEQILHLFLKLGKLNAILYKKEPINNCVIKYT